MKKFILLPLFSFFCLFSFGQNAKIDSLMNVLKTAKEDTNKVNILKGLAWEFGYSKPDTALMLCNQALRIAEKFNWQKGIGLSYHTLGWIYYAKSDYYISLEYYSKALMIYESIKKSLNTGKLPSDDINAKINESEIRQMKSTTLGNIGIVYDEQGSYTKALDYYFKALKIDGELGNKKGVARHIGNLGLVYKEQGNYPKALDYYFQALKMEEEFGNKEGVARNLGNIGSVYNNESKLHGNSAATQTQLVSKAIDYYLKSMKIKEEIGNKKGMSITLGNIGNVYFDQKNYPNALKYYSKALKMDQEIDNKIEIARQLFNIGRVYLETNKYQDAELYFLQAINISDSINVLELQEEIENRLSYLYELTGNYKKSLVHYKKEMVAKDSLYSADKAREFTRKEMQYDFDKKEAATKAETDKKEALAKVELQKQKIIRNSIAGGTGILVISSIFSFLFYKRKREASFKTEVSEVEMKALRSQMNPHFIFNSLNSIKRYMANHDNKTAEDYLTKFASVMRMILENSEHKEVPLQQDLKALELYMQLESLRMKKKFNYEIKVDESIDEENTLIPPLILQPFVENSIWHGLAEKDGDGKICISIKKIGEMIECTVEDNGVGRKKSEEIKGGYTQVEKKSLGMKITNARIDILNKIKKSKAGVELVDLAEGMKVIVKLPLELSF